MNYKKKVVCYILHLHTSEVCCTCWQQVVCRILHTSDFCRETLEALESAIAKDIKPAWSDKVRWMEEWVIPTQCIAEVQFGFLCMR